MNSKQRDVQRKHRKRKVVLKNKNRKPARKGPPKEKQAFAVGHIKEEEFEEFEKDIINLDMYNYGVIKLHEEPKGMVRITITACDFRVEHMRHSFHASTGMMRKWGDRFRVSLA